MDQASDFLKECRALEQLLIPLSEADFQRPTGFKFWTINQILRHLQVWNYAADLSLTDAETFKIWIKQAIEPVNRGGMLEFEEASLEGLSGKAIFERWREFYPVVANHFSDVDPAMRVAWAGPSMSARSSITARLMETWAHGQAIYDELGCVRKNTSRIQNIVVLGINTYDWTFVNRGLTPPLPRPQLFLTAPSCEIWTYGDEANGERIKGLAEEFCQVVTQTRSITDTKLVVSGANAHLWMKFAQCFAGPPNDPPRPGERAVRIL